MWFSWQCKNNHIEPNFGLMATLEKTIKTYMTLNLFQRNIIHIYIALYVMKIFLIWN